MGKWRRLSIELLAQLGPIGQIIPARPEAAGLSQLGQALMGLLTLQVAIDGLPDPFR